MKVLVTGATGFTGSYTVPVLLEAGHEVTCFVRPSSDLSHLPQDQIELAYGDLDDPASLEQALQGCDVLVNIASLGFGHADNIVTAAQATPSLQRAIFISTTAIFTTLNAPSKVVRMAAEATIQESGLPYTILRPTMIYGSSRDRNICRLIRLLQRTPLMPIFGTGRFLQQPVYVGDVAQAISKSIVSSAAIGRAYNVSGGMVVDYRGLISTITQLTGRRVIQVPLPARPIVWMLDTLQSIGISMPIKGEQIQRLNENKDFDYSQAAADFDYRPLSLEDGLRLELQEMNIPIRS